MVPATKMNVEGLIRFISPAQEVATLPAAVTMVLVPDALKISDDGFQRNVIVQANEDIDDDTASIPCGRCVGGSADIVAQKANPRNYWVS